MCGFLNRPSARQKPRRRSRVAFVFASADGEITGKSHGARNAALRGLNPKRDLKDAYLPRMLTYPVVGVRPAQARREQQSAPLYLSGRCYGWLRLGYFSTKGAVRVA